MDTYEVVMHEMQRRGGLVVGDFLAERVGEPRESRMLIRIVRFCRSAKLVETCAASGLPVTAISRVPVQWPGLYFRCAEVRRTIAV